MIEQTYSPEQIAEAMRSVGFDESKIKNGVAIVYAESGGRAGAVNNNPGVENSIGPWQINLDAHPGVTVECARDILCATREAFRISGGGESWTPWGAFTNGSFARFLDKWSPDTAAVGPVGPQGPQGPAVGAADCRPFNEIDLGRTSIMHAQGRTPKEIADALGISLGCLAQNAKSVIGNIESTPVVGDAARAVDAAGQAITSAKTMTEFATDSRNWWRAAFLALGAVLVFMGVRLYMAPSQGPAEVQSA